jgi:putative glutamine amidotransferase
MTQRKPVVLVPACNRQFGKHPFHIAGKKYIDAVRLAGCQPLVVPSAQPDEFEALIDLADGILLTGSPSNVHPSHFMEEVHDPALPLDPDRDAWTLPLIPRVLERGLPFFAICRGAQETNVALGGSLHQAVHEIDGHLDHRDPQDESLDVQYAPAHSADVLPGGVLARILQRDRIQINSLHGQAVNRLANGLRVEARAPDGVIEAFSRPDAPGFNLAVQWHPEWQAASNPISMQLLRAFGAACAERQQSKQHR